MVVLVPDEERIVQEKIKVYIADVSILIDPSWYENASARVSEERLRKAEGYRFMKDKALSLGAGILLRYALKSAGIDSAEMAVTAKGKPYLENHSELSFSLSHSGTLVMCVAGGVPVGCDVQEAKQAPLEASHLVFSKEEREHLAGLKEEAARDYFFAVWTGKESFLKMTGEGLSGRPDEFTIALPLGEQEIRESMVTFWDIPCECGYRAAVCAAGIYRREDLSAEYVDLREIMMQTGGLCTQSIPSQD